MKKIYEFIDLCSKKKTAFIVLLILKLLYSVLILSSSEVLRRTIKVIEDNDISMLQNVVSFAAIITAGYIIVDFTAKVTEQKLTNRCETFVQSFLLNKLFQLKKDHFINIASGEIITKIVKNTEEAIKGTMDTLHSTTTGIFGIILGTLYMTYHSPKLMVLIVAFNVVFRLVTKKYDKKIRAIAKKGVDLKNRNSAFVVELLHMMPIIKVFRTHAYFNKSLMHKEQENMINEVKGFAMWNSYSELRWVTNKFAELIILYGYGGWLVSRGEVSFSVIIAFTLASDYFSKGVGSLLTGITVKNRTIPHIDAIIAFLDDPHIEAEQGTLTLDKETNIEFDKVSFGYGENTVLEDVSFTVKQGEWIQIKGPNGHGKSTLLNLILGFYRPCSGRVLYGGQDTTSTTLDSIAKQYSYIAQHAHVLEGSMYDNVVLNHSNDIDAYDKIINWLNLSKVKDSDCNSLSQGERQRLSIGRAIYQMQNRPLVIGDEIFANIDKANAANIVKVLIEICKGKTVFFVCHEEMNFPFDKTLIVENKQVCVVEGGITI